jgi:hypothetical protein
MAGITDLVSIISGISALVGIGSASVTELGAARQHLQPPRQQLVQPQRCPATASDGTPVQAQIRTLPDGSLQIVCVEHVP